MVYASLLFPSLLLFLSLAGTATESSAQRAPIPPKRFEKQKNRAFRKEQENMRFCNSIDVSRMKPPQVYVTIVKQSSALRGGKYKVRGVVEGICIKEAGLYSHGERIFKFPVETTPLYKRYEYELEVKADDNPEVRAFSTNWQRASAMLLSSLEKPK